MNGNSALNDPESQSSHSNGDEPQTCLTTEELAQELAALNAQRAIPSLMIAQRLDLSPTSRQRLGEFTVAALILNRTIGSGIFGLPKNILEHTGSSGVSILLWVVGGLIVLSLHLCWLELGMSVPYFSHVDEDGSTRTIPVPRSGGDKNFLEYIYNQPRLLASCVFGVIFIIFGHLAANAVQFGLFIMRAIRPDCEEGDECFSEAGVIGWAIAVVTICALINVGARQFAITLNNIFAVGKVLFVASIALLGIIWGTIHENQCRKITWEYQKTNGSSNFGDIVLALLFAAYPYSGFEQPFYVLAEVKSPRRVFPRATILAMLTVLVLFPLANVGYLCVTPYTGDEPPDMVIAMFEKISGTSSHDNQNPDYSAVRAVSALLSVSIFGNIMAQTFTGSRVKQEIAKEGILPFSLLFATGSDSLLSRLSQQPRTSAQFTLQDIEYHPEQVPIAATFLHWVFEVIFILVFGIVLGPNRAYGVLAAIKTATLVGLLGLFTSAGLLYLKVDSWINRKTEKGRQWARHCQWHAPLSPLHAIVATAGLALMVFGTFAPPNTKMPKAPHWVGPFTAWAAVAVAIAWWAWLMLDEKRRKDFILVTKKPFIERDGECGEMVLKAEIVSVERIPARARRQVKPELPSMLP
ncbi:hypothetical protein jhhlp_000793 [Lomentospora prolificans]|uniref:Amino acid transporter transmembrane domain-containing protein n=1 Tax=Lomentospora prolificans TaxID=41688 RepID=A0A2N3NJG1_9PEZI|nr:hypothetical protein jhhlp_000793 [Lomentospora prolificans]